MAKDSDVYSSVGGLAGSFFGSGAHSTDWSSIAPYTAALDGIGGHFNALGLDSLGDYAADNGAYRTALGNYKDYLTKDPYTDSRDASYINTATSGLGDAYNKANASLSANLAARGIDPNSSLAVGGAAGIEAGRASALSSAQNGLARSAVTDHERRLQGLLSLMGGAANTDYNRGAGALDAASGSYDKLLKSGMDQSEFDQQRKDKNSVAFTDSLSGLGTAIGGLFGL